MMTYRSAFEPGMLRNCSDRLSEALRMNLVVAY